MAYAFGVPTLDFYQAGQTKVDPSRGRRWVDLSSIAVLSAATLTVGTPNTGPFTDPVAALPGGVTLLPGATKFDYWCQRTILLQTAAGGVSATFLVEGKNGAIDVDDTIETVSAPVDAQDETDYDNTPTSEGTFSGGTGHAANDILTLSDGTLITVDAVSSGVVTQFTVSSNTSTGAAVGDVLTQADTRGSGTGFTLTPDTDNIAVRDGKITGMDRITSITAVTDPGAQVTLTAGNAWTRGARAIRMPTGGDITFRLEQEQFFAQESSYDPWAVRAGEIAEISAASATVMVEI